MKRLILIITALAVTVATMAQKTTVTCTFNGLENGTTIQVSVAEGGKMRAAETLTPNEKGQISLSREVADPTLMVLSTSQKNGPVLHLMLMPKEKITLKVDYMPAMNLFNITSAKGSENMRLYKEFTNLLVRSQEIPFAVYLDSLLSANSSVLMSAFLVTFFEQEFERYIPLYKKVRDALIGQWPDNEHVKYIDNKLRRAILPGTEAPDIALADREGNIRHLHDLRGKVVLIDFWASWCRPCRMENPNVVRLYNQYHDRGFEIFSVSLDNNREAWLKAIEDDHLSWPNHVSDLRGWSSAAGRLYGIQSIPATVLLDANGNVLARNLRGRELENKLKEIFAQ